MAAAASAMASAPTVTTAAAMAAAATFVVIVVEIPSALHHLAQVRLVDVVAVPILPPPIFRTGAFVVAIVVGGLVATVRGRDGGLAGGHVGSPSQLGAGGPG
jgi:hypothetical protein